jgi:hypothetical protein
MNGIETYMTVAGTLIGLGLIGTVMAVGALIFMLYVGPN